MANTFKLKTKANLTTSLAAVYTVPSSKTAISAVTADVQVVSDTSDTETNADSYLLKGAPLPSGSTLEIMQGNKLVLQTTDVLKAKASAGTSVDMIVSLMEMDV